MADFVAVIRKAVDGLANNTPETRSKVYEKARSAVVRQLENMKPRPPEELLNRQISKLDAAIAEVESEYAEALPPLEDDDFDDLQAQDVDAGYDNEEPVQEVEEQEEPAAEDEPEHIEPVYQAPAPLPQDDEIAAEGSYEQAPADEPRLDETADGQDHEPDTTAPDEVPAEEPEEEHAHANWVGSDTPNEPDWDSTYRDESETAPEYPGQWTQHSSQDSALEASDYGPASDDLSQSYTSSQQYHQEVTPVVSEAEFEPIAHGRQPIDAAAEDIFGSSSDPHDGFGAEREEDEQKNSNSADYSAIGAATGGAGALAGAASSDFKQYFDDAIDRTETTSTQGTASTLPRADEDPFAATSDKKRDAWDDLEDLIGYDGRSADGENKSNVSADDSTIRGETGSIIPPNVYVKPKKNRTKEILFGTVAALVVAAIAYGLWDNRAALNDMVGGLTESAQTDTSTSANGQNASAPSANEGTATGSPAPSSDPSSNGETKGTKFTQRLLPDGTEKDEGAAPVASNQPVTAEGVTQTEQNEAPPSTAPAQTATAPTAAPATPAASPTTPAVAVAGERVFLYEEVLGQSVPNAIAGTAAWSLASEQDANGRSAPTVQAQINVPDRGLSALLTFKKNTDASLPASHIIEIVFSTGPGFDGGVIDSVQRVAMKSTEQDRGNALVAVPAKITDDFHMIALNDFPDARKTNVELLKTRDWIDIPLAYRNGRRALLTLQKGPAGKQAFDSAIRDWEASSPSSQ